jgi:hypothetical protein
MGLKGNRERDGTHYSPCLQADLTLVGAAKISSRAKRHDIDSVSTRIIVARRRAAVFRRGVLTWLTQKNIGLSTTQSKSEMVTIHPIKQMVGLMEAGRVFPFWRRS